jgi:hypothetical protein
VSYTGFLPPGTPLAPYGGVGVAGQWTVTHTPPPKILFAGWLDSALEWVPPDNVETLVFYWPPPEDAPPPPDGGSIWITFVQMPFTGWFSDIQRGYP